MPSARKTAAALMLAAEILHVSRIFVGGTLALMRYVTSPANPVLAFLHLTVHLVVISICIRLLPPARTGTRQS